MDMHVPASTSRFFGEVERSKFGTHPVLRYPIPGGSLCYVFIFTYARKGGLTYRCRECRKRGKCTIIQVVNGNQFVRDPALIPHVCLPLKNAQEKVTHTLYKEYQGIRKDPRQASKKPRQLWQELAKSVENDAMHDEALRDDMTYFFYKDGFKSRRDAIKKAVAALKGRHATMENVPNEFAFLPDGSRFLQYSSSTLHIYFSEQILEKACQVGLCALVADGVHNLQPQPPKKMGQLYTIHGVMANSVDVPLLFAITTRKTQAVYESVFEALKNAVVACAPERLRIVLDYEKAAVAAVKKIFPSGSVEGCAFHLAQAWNRKRNALGLRQYIRGARRCKQLEQWWSTIKGLVFLPPHLHWRVPALQRPPVPRQHSAYERCCMFLEYVRKTWYEDPFKGMWHKWDVPELRTTNVAESFHRLLGILLEGKYPSMSDLILTLQGCVTTARGALLNAERRRTQRKRLNKRDILRRRRIEKEMARFKLILHRDRAFLRTVTITTYCRRMSRFLTEKVV